MQTSNRTNDTITLSLDPIEQLCLSNVLNEVCNGIEIKDFYRRMGISKQEIHRFHNVLAERIGSDSMEVVFTLKEMVAVRNALSETLK